MRKILLIIGGLFFVFSASAETEMEALTKRVKELEETLFYIKFLGLPSLALTTVCATIWAAYMWFKGIKDKVNEVIENDATKKLEEMANTLVNKKLETYPFIAEFDQKQKAKNGSILIVSKEGKQDTFDTLLKTHGFINLTNRIISPLEAVDVDEYKIILFNDQEGDLKQEDMDKVVEKYNGQIRFLHYNITNKRFESEHKVKNILYANSPKTLEQRLAESLL